MRRQYLLGWCLSASVLSGTAASAEPLGLGISRFGDRIVLSWPVSYPTVQIQFASSGGDSPWDWQPVGVAPERTGEVWEATLPLEDYAGFFRAVSPLNHVLVVGQSLGMGAYASDLLSTNQWFENRMFIGQMLDGHQPGLLADDLSQLVPLVEQWQPSQNGGETIASGFANWISHLVGPGAHDFLVSNCARGGALYEELRRDPSGQPEVSATGTVPYLRGLAQIEAGRRLAGSNSYQFRAILAVHGEGDSINQVYDRDIRQWRIDYEADIHRLTGQTNVIPMLHTQISAWGNLGNATRTLSPFRMLDEFERDPLRTVLVGPKYFLPYRPEDGLHLTSLGYAWLGEYYAKAYRQLVIEGQAWSPVRPMPDGITRSNNIVEIQFTGQIGDLVFDTNLVTNPQGVIFDARASPSFGVALIKVGPYGFEYWDSHGTGAPWECSTVIVEASLVGTDTVRLTLNQAPLGQGRRIRYGYTALPAGSGGGGGPLTGPRGCLRDSDPSEPRHGPNLFNWCVHFDEACP